MQPLTAREEAWRVWQRYGKSEDVMLAILAELIADNNDMKQKLEEGSK